LKLELAQYRSLEAFAMFASDLDAASRGQLQRGAALMELLKQPQYSPYAVEDQVASVWAGTKSRLDDVPVQDIKRFESEMLDHLHRKHDVLEKSAETGKWGDDIEEALAAGVDEFRKGFVKSDGKALVGGDDG